MNTGENQQGLRQVMDFTRLLSLTILLLHFYISCHAAFREWGLVAPVVDKIIHNVAKLSLFQDPLMAKAGALLLLLISLLGTKGKKDERIHLGTALACLLPGLLLYFVSQLLLTVMGSLYLAVVYMATCWIGYLLLLSGGTLLSRLLRLTLGQDIFNKENQSFPQEERLLENEYSVNLPAHYVLKGKKRKSWINIINPFRALLIIGTPGSGKSYFVIRHVITQHIRKGFTMFLYDFKYDDLTRIAYNALLRHAGSYPVRPKFYLINFDDLSRSHRCNPLDPHTMTDITDATEASRTIMLGLNREWIKKQGDFFVESPINFVTAIIWFLRKYEGGRYCTLPHVIELMQVEYEKLFAVLRTEPEIEVLINPFVSAFEHEAMEQLEGQVASAKISMARLSSPQLYYVLSGNDFTLDLNNPESPKVISLGNNPQKQQVYGAVLSLYISRAIKLVNQKGRLKSSLIFDEFPTIYFNGIDSLIATARSNKVATTLAVQDYSQLKKDYGREQAEVVMNIVGNVISGQVSGETARQLSERFGKVVQQRESVSINSSDTSVSRSTQLDAAIPPATIASLSSGEFVGTVADDPLCRVELKTFHATITNDHSAIAEEEKSYLPIPIIRELNAGTIQENYNRIREDISTMIKKSM
ncbi:type IV secretory system conjugative DNA transfer VirD4/TraG family protein [Pontibacter ummariensis]|uniref:Type IV secretory system Conjugative DNA transfer n=1 Tax=Pontibacter ummariensis TaxID=1610492 RepID=A0A239LIK9_9BACT|nr:conjugal transfer protein MobC [Pontibacter ummariensis]PRY03351.1 type IV secretory system conjugative DNA transfer VirD4/TraG family protein [Pontibacter ummariensis]SNT29752.1 Type IV secretory system Conjugative DNA transfer [Pontibacter ummariensis]